MVREKKMQESRFFLLRMSRFGREYYHESGTQDVGTPFEQEYVNWTRYRDCARGFRTMKQARRMADLLWSKFGQKVIVVDHYGGEVF